MSDQTTDRLFFRQLLSGQDFAAGDPMARQMVNFAYLIGDRDTGECVLVDPAYAVNELVDTVEAEGLRVSGVLATHYHGDHIGGTIMGHTIEGVESLLERCDVPIHVNKHEVPWILKTTGLTESQLTSHDSGDVVTVGGIDITLVHTPGHTPGSQCFLTLGCLVSGDTLFLEGCGRTDLPGSDPELMWESLSTLSSLPDDTVLLPGHRYSQAPAAAMGDVRNMNYVFKPRTKEQWMVMFGH